MLLTAREKLINDLAMMSEEDFGLLLEEVENARQMREEAERREALSAFNKAWERLEDLGLRAYCGSGDKELPIHYITWKE